MTVRQRQIESTLHRTISTVLRDLQDPRIRGLVSVLGVDMSPDRKNANVRVSVVPKEYELRTIAALKAASKRIQSKVFRAVSMKVVPRLHFAIDRSIKHDAEVFQAIREGIAEDERRRQAREAAPADESSPSRDGASDDQEQTR